MPKQKRNLNDVYISERLKKTFEPVSRCAMTTVVAPMGYGKTTAVNWFLGEREKTNSPNIVRISVYSDNLTMFWKSVQDAFLYSGFEFFGDYPCPSDKAGEALLADDLCHELKSKTPCYIFIDDFHLLTDERVPFFLCSLANRLPQNVHLIVAGRDRFLPIAEIVRLGGKVCQIGTEQLRLNRTELVSYAHRCGTELSDEETDKLLYFSEGWFSAVYLNLLTLCERGALPDSESDIYSMFTSAMIDTLCAKSKEFVAVMGLADEFGADMACYVTGEQNSDKIIAELTERNAFVKRLPDGYNFRFHHMMKECAERTFLTLDKEKQRVYKSRFGEWHENHGQYLHAMSFFRQSKNYDALLRVVQKDAGILLSSLAPSDVIAAVDECPRSVLKEHLPAVLVLMRCMFNWRLIPKMTELKNFLLSAVEENKEMPQIERGNILGECDLIMSFLLYNDIGAMSRLHRSASRQMSRNAISIHKSGGWTFGSPSVLMMFHREPGVLKNELAEMDECMPHYYKITENHGQGAEKIMRAEACFLQGHFADAQIELEKAYSQIEGNGQENMALCCDFLLWRLSLLAETEPRHTFERRYAQLLEHHNIAWINIWNAVCSYYYALLGKTEKIPEIFSLHKLSSVNILAPGKPMIDMIENQVYLAQGAYAKVIGRSEGLFNMCDGMHYALVLLHSQIQTAAALEMLGKHEQARILLERALENAVPDGFIIPFAENYGYIKNLLKSIKAERYADFICQIKKIGTEYELKLSKLKKQNPLPSELEILSEREYEIVILINKRLSNREIAEKLFLSEGSVKQYINRIYSKLNIDGDVRTKRKRLAQMTKT